MTDLIPPAVLAVADFIPPALLVGLLRFMYVRREDSTLPGKLRSGLIAAGLGWWVFTHTTGLVVASLVLFTFAAVCVTVVRRSRTAATVNRWGNRSRNNSGVATMFDIFRVASGWAMRRRSAIVRPSLPAAPWKAWRSVCRPPAWRAWLGTPITEFSLRLVRVGKLWIHACAEDVVLIIGGPRKGKTALLGCLVLDAPGALVTTSTRLDVMEQTAVSRRGGGRPVYVFNPNALGGVESTIAFDPLTGCTEPVTANRRAQDMIPDSGHGSERAVWEQQARRVLAALMHAAALGGLSMTDVLRWTAVPKAAELKVMSLIRRSPEPSFAPDLKQFFDLNDRTQSSITTSVMPALSWLNIPSASAATKGEPFDVDRLLRERGTVYLLGEEDASTAPLLAAFTGYIAREARRLAALSPKGRLDPHLSLLLDEAHRVAPVPLPLWTGDMGGAGVQITICVQSRADLSGRYGPDGMAKVLNNSAVIVLFGGTSDDAELTAWSRLAGDRDEIVKTTQGRKVTSRTERKVAVLTPTQIAGLPKFRAVVFVDGMPPAVGETPAVWTRPDVRRPAPVASPASVPVAPAMREPAPELLPASAGR